MKKGIFFDYGNGQADLVIEKLKEAKVMDTIVWIDNAELFEINCKKENRVPLRMPDYDWFDLRELKIPNHSYKNVENQFKVGFYENFYKDFYNFILKAGREDIKTHANLNRSYNSHLYTNSSVYSLQHIFFTLTNFFTDMLITNKIEVVYFNNLPHEGADYILYLRAKDLGIKTILAAPSMIFPNKFFYSLSIGEFGDFDILPTISTDEPYKIIEKPYDALNYTVANKEFILSDDILDPYIKEIFCQNVETVKIKEPREKIKHYFLKIFSKKAKKSKNRDFKELNRFISNAMIFLNFTQYKKNLDANTQIQFDYNKKYVYFPLHYQPEATTGAFADIFNDQILALEKISNLIPDDWFIYAKEHYPQREWMRDPVFFERLSKIEKVKLIPKTNPTFELIKKSQFIATITGTAGWEAIGTGKKVLIFGRAWYINLPGVFFYDKKLKLIDILNYKIAHEELEIKTGQLLSKMGDGVIDCDFIMYQDNFNQDTNLKNIINSLTKII